MQVITADIETFFLFKDPSSMTSSGLLEWEFSLPSDQIISHGWYHGALSRTAAETLLQQDREFLVRDSSSQPDNYVLSCRSNGQHLHFVIQRVSLQCVLALGFLSPP